MWRNLQYQVFPACPPRSTEFVEIYVKILLWRRFFSFRYVFVILLPSDFQSEVHEMGDLTMLTTHFLCAPSGTMFEPI